MCLEKKSLYDKKLDKNIGCLRINVIIDKKFKNYCKIKNYNYKL